MSAGYATGSVVLGCGPDYEAASRAILAGVVTSATTSSTLLTTLETRRFTCRWDHLFANDRATAAMVAAASIRARYKSVNSASWAVLCNGVGGSTSCTPVRYICNFAAWNSNACRALLWHTEFYEKQG